MNILAIETSCDETSIAILQDNRILSNIVSSQINTHKKYGGVVPEIASRLHFENFGYVLGKAIIAANINIHEIDYVAYTNKPGLIGCLNVGKVLAKTIASYNDVPLITCDHVQGHIYSAAINHDFDFPALFLVVSGGHTQLVLLKKHLDFNILGSTVDDAVGETYDKVGRMLGLEYPAGPKIDSKANKGLDEYILPMSKNDNTLDFSFSGLKSACLNLINKNKDNKNFNITNFLCSFQNNVVKTLMNKLDLASKKYDPKLICVVGGVSANSLLRKEIQNYCKLNSIKCILPDISYCTDNAAMIARLAYEKIIKKNNR